MLYCREETIGIDCFFFFKQKTAYEMRISDWSSDVCSSDLASPKPLIVTFAPSAANARAVASPMPLVDPVTSALLPFRNIGKLLGQSLVRSKAAVLDRKSTRLNSSH